MIEGNSDNFKKEVLDEKGIVLVDFNATWCGPCRMLHPVLEEFSNKRKDIKVVTIDTDENEKLSSDYGIMSIPCLILFKEGKEINRSVGLKSKSEIEGMLE